MTVARWRGRCKRSRADCQRGSQRRSGSGSLFLLLLIGDAEVDGLSARLLPPSRSTGSRPAVARATSRSARTAVALSIVFRP